jgi:SpoVK/Ycf46/Vps4 family AAA+-type ATPase
MVGSQAPQREEYGLRELLHALKFLNETNNHWASLYPAVRPPYFSPLLVPPRMPSPSSSTEPPSGSNLSGAAAAKEYNSDEKRLLSGLINAKDIHTTFNDIIVPQETKESLIGLTSLSLIRPEAFSYGVLKTERIPGCLLYGPPGTGKTLLAKAVAKESGASMLEVSAASINDKWLGQSEKNVQALFSLARKLSPCVIFLDEADALLAARRSSHARAAHRETITQFLREWDGLSDMRAFIMVATNRPFDLDEAVLRRLPRKILVDLPLAPEREAILRVMLKDETLAEDVDLAALAQETDLYSGSDLKNLCVSAAMEAVREEVRAKEAWTGEGEYQWPERRVLNRRHFDKGLREISASISGDMESLKAIRKFDEQFGDAGRKRKARRGIGFEVVPGPKEGTEEARVRQVGV